MIGTKTRIAALLVILALVGLTCQAALAYWSGVGNAGDGDGIAGAATVNQGAAPTASEVGSTTVTVNWGSSGLSNGVPASGYVVKRYAQATGTQSTLGGGCAGVIAAATCTETSTPVGNWQYTVTPVFGTNWRGVESVKSGAVNTGPGSLTLTRSLFGGTVAPLPAVVSGTVSGFAPNQPIAFFLDGTVALTGSPTQVGAGGGATISVTLPAGTADGPHTLSVRSATTEASSGILVDNTPPTIEVVVIPPPNAAGWNRTAPVEVGGTTDDGNGSGVAYAKYTEDGSDPKTSPTAKYETEGPVSVSTTTTLKFFIADNAGNESPVITQLVKIDTAPPYFSVENIDIEGGYYQEPGDARTGLPGTTYYRGAAAGSFRLRLTPLPMGGSPAVSAGFSELSAEAIGFSFDSTSVTTPVGGPFVSDLISWVAGTTANGGGAVSLTNEAGSTFGASGLTHNDSTPPTGGSVDAEGLTGTGGRYSTSLELKLGLAKGTDSGSGLADGTGPSDLPDKLERASAPLSTSNGIAEGTCGAFSTFVQVGANNPPSSVTDTVPVDDSCYLYRYLVSDHVGNVATYTSPAIKVQTAADSLLRPTNAVLTPVSGTASQSISGSTIFYNPSQSGSFNVDSSASSPYSGVAQATFPAIAGFSGGGAVTSPLTGTTFRSTYSWSANGASPSPGAQPISATNNAGQTATNPTAFTVVKDNTGPAGGSVDATGLGGTGLGGTGGRYSTSTTLSVAFSPGADAGSGLAAGGAQLLRASAALASEGGANGSCGSFGPYTQIGANDPTTPKSDTVPADRTCYRYAYVVADKVGNQTTYLSPDVKVDATTPPAPVLTFSAPNNAYWSGSGTTVFYRPGATGGGFQLTANSADTTAGISSYTFPTLPTGWSSSSGGTGIRNYAWSAANPVAPTGGQTVTAINNAGRESSSAFTATPDSTAPTGGFLTYTNGYSVGSTVSISFTKGTDTISGLDSASGILEGATATFAAGACGTFGSFAIVAANPASGVSLPVTSGTCYQYRYSIADNVGNRTTYTSASVTKVDNVAPVDSLSLEGAVNASQTGNTVYYRGTVAGSFKVVDAPTDAASGPASSTFPAIATTGWTHEVETISTPTGGPYVSSPFSWTAGAANPTAKTVFSTDLAGKSSTAASLNFASDIVAPSGGSITYTNGILNSTSVPITTVNGSDGASGINTATTKIKRDVAPLTTASETCGTFPGTYATTVTLIGGADASVTSGNCYRYEYLVSDKVGNQAVNTSASVAKVDTSGPRVTAIESRQSSGSAGNGKLEVGDKLIVTFNQALAAGSVPTSFSGATEISPSVLADVTLVIPGVTNGSLDTGTPFYLQSPSTTATFGGSLTLANNGTATTLTIVVSTLSGGATSAASGSLVFKPAPTITDGGGNAASVGLTTSLNFKLF
jgi:hypothetical protein